MIYIYIISTWVSYRSQIGSMYIYLHSCMLYICTCTVCVTYNGWIDVCIQIKSVVCFFMCTVQISVFALCSIPMAFQCMHAHGQGMHAYIYTYIHILYIYI